MGKLEIADKLRQLLTEKFPASECEVVYFMVEVRKLLERILKERLEEETRKSTGESRRELKYRIKQENPSLWFYCDWVCHSELDGNPEVKKILDTVEECGRQHIPVAHREETHSFIRFLSLKEELGCFLEQNNLPMFTDNKENWLSFRGFLIQVISDCHLVCNDPDSSIDSFYFVADEHGISYVTKHKDGRNSYGTYLEDFHVLDDYPIGVP